MEGSFLCAAVPGPVPTLPPLRLLQQLEQVDFGMCWCQVVGSHCSREAQARAHGGEAEIKGFALLADGLSSVRAKWSLNVPPAPLGISSTLCPAFTLTLS